MFYKKSPKPLFLITLIFFLIIPFRLLTANPPEPPLTAPLPAKAGAQSVTPEWLLSLPNLSDVKPFIQWIDKDRIIYSLPSLENEQKEKIELIDIKTGKHTYLGQGSFAKPSPDGKWIVFVRGEGKDRQLWIMQSDGSQVKQLSYLPEGLGFFYQFSYDFAWSPDSKSIALSHQPNKWYWEPGPQPKSSIYLIERATGKSKQIAFMDAKLRYLSWIPKGNEILFMKERAGLDYNSDTDWAWVQAVNVDTQHIRTLAEFEGLQQFLQPTASPDGKTVALMYDADHPSFNFMTSIGLVSAGSVSSKSLPPIYRLTHEVKLDFPQWSPDGNYIYVRRDYGAYKQLYVIDAKTGESKQLTNAPLNIENYAPSPDGLHLAWIGQDAQANRILRVASNKGQNVQDLLIVPEAPSDMALSEVREISWKTADYPVPMRGLLFLPLQYQVGQRYPLIVDIHGGDVGASIYLQGNILLSTPLEWHMWATKGYAVFVPEFRSSASFGSLAITRDVFQEHDRLNGDLKDIEAGVNELIAQGIVDKQRLAVIGHSAGGLRANWLTAVTHRYKAVISKEGWADELILISNDPPSKGRYLMFGGTPWEVPQNYLKNSPLHHSKGATTPTLFLMGNPELGGANKYDTVNLLYDSLKFQGIETQFIYYSDEGHLLEKPENRKDALERSIKWMDDHMEKHKG